MTSEVLTFVDAEKLNDALHATADSIRNKTGNHDDISWNMDTGFAHAISACNRDREFIESTIESFIDESGAYSIIRDGAFNGHSNLTAVSFPACKTIGERAFANCSALSFATFWECSNIGDYAFSKCSSLMSVALMGSYFVTCPSNAFQETPIASSEITGSYGSIYVPMQMLESYKSMPGFSDYKDRLVGIQAPVGPVGGDSAL